MDLIKVLQKENRLLTLENSAYKAQSRLFERLLEMAGSAAEEKMLNLW